MKLFLVLLLALQSIVSVSYAQDKNYEEWYLATSDNQALFVKELGTGKDTVIVLHGGFGANHDYMMDIAKGLEKKFHFVFYDQRGSLLSPVDDSLITFQNNVHDVLDLLNSLHITKATLVCHSMGTLVGMEFQQQYPERVRRLVLIGSIFMKADSLQSIFSEQMGKNIEWLTTRKQYTDVLQSYEARKKNLTDKERTELWRIKFAGANIYTIEKWKLMKGGQAYYNGKTGSLMSATVDYHYDYSASLSKAPWTTTLLQGQYDFLDFDAKKHRELIGNLPITLVLIKNAGHNSWIDQPDIFRRELEKALHSGATEK